MMFNDDLNYKRFLAEIFFYCCVHSLKANLTTHTSLWLSDNIKLFKAVVVSS